MAVEVRLVGRGGQGVVTAGELLGHAVVHEGRWAQSIPTFGPERRGALSSCTVRVSDEEILLKHAVPRPNVLVVLDPTIWHSLDVLAGLQQPATLVFNSPRAPAELADELRSGRFGSRLRLERFTLYSVDATQIALEVLKRPITNTALLGALCGATALVQLTALEATLAAHFGAQAAANISAARAASARLQKLGS